MTQRILDVVEEASWHIFATLTKAPQNARPFVFPDNVWFGVTVNEQADVWRLEEARKHAPTRTWAIFEPLYSPIDCDLTWLDWIIIGPQTRPTFQPKGEWVKSVIDHAEGVPVFMKPGLKWSPKLTESPSLRGA